MILCLTPTQSNGKHGKLSPSLEFPLFFTENKLHWFDSWKLVPPPYLILWLWLKPVTESFLLCINTHSGQELCHHSLPCVRPLCSAGSKAWKAQLWLECSSPSKLMWTFSCRFGSMTSGTFRRWQGHKILSSWATLMPVLGWASTCPFLSYTMWQWRKKALTGCWYLDCSLPVSRIVKN